MLVYVLAPQKLVGWNRKPPPEELPYLAPIVRDLPEIGRLTGRGGTANLEVVIAAKPDVIVDFGYVSDTYISLADRVQGQTGIPYLLVDGRFSNTVAALRSLGRILGVAERGELLARRTEEIFQATDRVIAAIPADRRPRVYFARGPRGLETGSRGSINTEIIERAGGINVVETGLERGGLYNASLEQVLAWNPDTIVTIDDRFLDHVKSTPGWSEVEAVRRGRIYLSPRLPYGWVDAPPSLNRLIGLQWLTQIFFADQAREDIRTMARDFYKLFYQVDLGEADLDKLFTGAQRGR